MVSDYLKDIYAGSTQAVHPGLWGEYFQRFKDRAEAGYGKPFSQPDDMQEWEVFQKMQKNLAEFAAFKQNALTEELKSKLTGPDGQRVSRAVFDHKARQVIRRHTQWLKTELQATEAAASSVESWREIQSRKWLYPNLRYETVGDERVRDEHRVLDGAVWPVDDPFWDTWFPPNGWNCRCIVLQTDQELNPLESGKPPAKGFRHNPGKTGKVFESDHPYYKTDTETKNAISHMAGLYLDILSKREIKIFAKRNIQNIKFDLPRTSSNTPSQLILSGRDIRDILAHFHTHGAERNNLFYVLQLALNQASFIADAPNHDPTKPHILWFWYYLVQIGEINFIFNVIEARGASYNKKRIGLYCIDYKNKEL